MSAPGRRVSRAPPTAPATPASTLPSTNMPVNTRSMLMPRIAAVSRSSTPARMIAPTLVWACRTYRPAPTASARAITNRRKRG